MPNEFRTNDPRSVWQSQRKEIFRMSAEEVRRKARRLERQAQLEVIGTIVIGLVLCVLFTTNALKTGQWVARTGWAVIGAWSLWRGYQAYRDIWPHGPGPDAPADACLEFYRRELRKRRHYAHHVWRKSGLTLLFAGLLLVILPTFGKWISINALPFFLLLGIWVVAFYFVRKSKLSRLDDDIEDAGSM